VPGFFLRPMEASVTRVIERVTGQQPAQVYRAVVPESSRPEAKP
jgi:hypothetical protein